jgi:hypothetical protein
MVELLAAKRLDDATLVQRPCNSGGIDADGDRASHQRTLERVRIVRLDLVVVGDRPNALRGVILAFGGHAKVRIVTREHLWVLLKVGEGVRHQTASAAFVILAVAVNQLLLGEIVEAFSSDGVCGLDSAGGRECPAGAA